MSALRTMGWVFVMVNLFVMVYNDMTGNDPEWHREVIIVATGLCFGAQCGTDDWRGRKVSSRVEAKAITPPRAWNGGRVAPKAKATEVAQLQEVAKLREHSPHVAKLIDDGRVDPVAAKYVNSGQMTITVKDFCLGCAEVVDSDKMVFTDGGLYRCPDCLASIETIRKESA